MTETASPQLDVPATAVVCPPETLDLAKDMLLLGTLYQMEHLLCPKADCNDGCTDRMMKIFQTLSTFGVSNNGPIGFAWGRGTLELVVRDPSGVALHAPEIAKSIQNIEGLGFTVKHELHI